MNRFFTAVPATLFAIALFHGQAAVASTISWQTPVNETGNASDILTTGTLVGAAMSGPSTTVNGVLFNGPSGTVGGVTSYGASNITLTGLSTVDVSYGSAPGGWNPSYAVLVGSGGYGSPGSVTLTLGGLTAGQSYEVQLLESFWNSNWATNFTAGASKSGNVNLSGPDEGVGASSVPQYVLGTFIADGATESIVLSSPTSYTIFTAGQVRDLSPAAIPEPSSIALLGTGFLGLLGAARRRKAL
jgi:hypothetical protein